MMDAGVLSHLAATSSGTSPQRQQQQQQQLQQQQQQQQQQQAAMLDSLSDEHDVKAPKKRAETWVQEEIRALIAYRKEMDSLFNTTKSNKHLWDHISSKMKERGFDRSPTMCTDKWRNLLKEYKKMKHHDKAGSNKVGCYKDLEELLTERTRLLPYRSPAKSDGNGSPRGVMGRTQFNVERRLEQDDGVGASNGLLQWSWRDASGNGGPKAATTFSTGRIIHIRLNDTTRRIGIDGSPESIREAIKAAFGLRTRRAFWLEDEDGVVWSIDRDMPLGAYILNLDDGVTIKVCRYDESDRLTGATEEKTLYTEDDFRDFLARRGWTGLREVGGFRDVEFLHELHSLCVYQRAGLLGA